MSTLPSPRTLGPPRGRGWRRFVCLAAATFGLLWLADPVRAATVTVTGTGDAIAVDQQVTLREAITSINNGTNVNADVTAVGTYGTADTIAFRIPFTGASVQTINVASALPVVTRPVIIDGATQTSNIGDTNPGSLSAGGTVGTTALALVPVDRPEIEIRATVAVANGLAVSGNNVVIRGLAVYGFGTANIAVQPNTNSVLIAWPFPQSS